MLGTQILKLGAAPPQGIIQKKFIKTYLFIFYLRHMILEDVKKNMNNKTRKKNLKKNKLKKKIFTIQRDEKIKKRI